MERPEEPFAIAVRNIDEYLGCSRLRWGSEAPMIRVRLENLDAIKPEGASSNAPFHPRGGEWSTQGRKNRVRGRPMSIITKLKQPWVKPMTFAASEARKRAPDKILRAPFRGKSLTAEAACVHRGPFSGWRS